MARASGGARVRAHGVPRVLHVLCAGPGPAAGVLEVWDRREKDAEAPVRACALAIARYDGAAHTALLLAGSEGERRAHTMGLGTLDRIARQAGVSPVRRVRRFVEHAGPFDFVKAWSPACEEIVRRAMPAAQMLGAPRLAWSEEPDVSAAWERRGSALASGSREEDGLENALRARRAAARRRLGAPEVDGARGEFVVALIADPPDASDAFEAQRAIATLEVGGLRAMGVLPSAVLGRERAMRQARAFDLKGPLVFVPTVEESLWGADAAVLLPRPPLETDEGRTMASALAKLWWAAEVVDRGMPLIATFDERTESLLGFLDGVGVPIFRLRAEATAHAVVAAMIPLIEARRSGRAQAPVPAEIRGLGGTDARGMLLRRMFLR
jgi:hypothetical protein